jgi:hypothetical protein
MTPIPSPVMADSEGDNPYLSAEYGLVISTRYDSPDDFLLSPDAVEVFALYRELYLSPLMRGLPPMALYHLDYVVAYSILGALGFGESEGDAQAIGDAFSEYLVEVDGDNANTLA